MEGCTRLGGLGGLRRRDTRAQSLLVVPLMYRVELSELVSCISQSVIDVRPTLVMVLGCGSGTTCWRCLHE